MIRVDGRKYDESRPVEITTGFIKFAEGSALIRCGDTVVLCNASVEDRVPPHVRPGCGWVTAEYSMLPRANRERSRRDVDKLKLSGRSAEIQRLIGRSLRAAVDMRRLASAPSPSTATCSREMAAPALPPSPAASWPWPWRAGVWWSRGW